MGLASSYWDLLIYKLRYVGLGNTVRVGYLDLSEHFLYQISKRFPVSFGVTAVDSNRMHDEM